MESTSTIRWAEAEALGKFTKIMESIITAMKVCMVYCRKAIRSPTCISPASMRWAANQIITMLVRLMSKPKRGMRVIMIRLTFSAVWVRSRFAWAKRARSSSSRLNARITRTP